MLKRLMLFSLFGFFIFPSHSEANNQFAFDLYAKYKTENENIFFSPYSISTALEMTYEGARGKTAEEMKTVLSLDSDDMIRRESFLRNYNDLNKAGKNYELKTANALWLQEDFPFLKDYLGFVEKYYKGNAVNLNFIKDTEGSRSTINRWVEGQTNNKIKNLIPEGCLDYMTRLVLTNAIYFKGKWEKQFSKADTKDEDFYVNDTAKIKVPMMCLTGENAEFNYAQTETAQILELPYKGDELSMLVLLPKGNNLAALESVLNSTNIDLWRKELIEQQVNVFIPKFKLECQYFMVGVLREMGMLAAFSQVDADFSGMTGKPDLYISKVIHQAFVDVNEEGTEAAAATAVVMSLKGMPSQPVIFNANHSFIFIIQERKSGNILFMGRVLNPKAERDDHF